MKQAIYMVFDTALGGGVRAAAILGPWTTMLLVGLVTSVLVLLVFKALTNQEALRTAKSRVIARLLELVLYKQDLRVNLTAFGRVLRENGTYLGHMLFPFAVVLVPVVLVLAQLSCWFQNRPLQPGETVILKAAFAPDYDVMQEEPQLAAADGLAVDTPGLRIPSRNEVDWRLVAVAPGHGWAELHAAGQAVRKTVATGDPWQAVSSRRTGNLLTLLALAPAEEPLPTDSPVLSIELTYPEHEHLQLFGADINWILAFFVVTLGWGLLLKKPMGVTL